MGCQDVRRVIYFFLDGSLSEHRSHDLTDHFRLCPDCDGRRQIHKRLRDFVHRRLARVAASERFKLRLERSLRSLHAD